MEDTVKISSIPDNEILVWWSSEHADNSQDYQSVVRLARTRGVKVGEQQVRRHIRKLLRQKRLLPLGRKPTNKDFALAKRRFRELWFDQPIF